MGTGGHMAEVGSWLHSYWGTHTLHGHHDTTHPGSRIDGYITTIQLWTLGSFEERRSGDMDISFVCIEI